MSELGYYGFMKRAVSALVAGFALILIPSALAQINGVPASVSSIGFGGHFNSPGVPASVTSIGPRGLVPNHQFFTTPNCCINPLFPTAPVVPGRRHHHGDRGLGFGQVAVYPVPYPVAVPVSEEEVAPDQADEQYNGGPTIFDRRGPGGEAYGQPSRGVEPAVETASASVPDAPAPDQPKTLLVFKDGHQSEVENYAIVGDTLYDLSEGRRHKIALADLNLQATAQQNEDRGIDFTIPATAASN
jgi:hypothetical protein